MGKLSPQPRQITSPINRQTNQWPPLELPPPRRLFDKHPVLGPEHIESLEAWYMALQNTLDQYQRQVADTITGLQAKIDQQNSTKKP